MLLIGNGGGGLPLLIGNGGGGLPLFNGRGGGGLAISIGLGMPLGALTTDLFGGVGFPRPFKVDLLFVTTGAFFFFKGFLVTLLLVLLLVFLPTLSVIILSVNP